MGKVTRVQTPLRAAFEDAAKALDGVSAKVGWFDSSKYPDGTPAAYIASIHEFGYEEGGIPMRATMRPTIAAEQNKWAEQIGKGAKSVINGNHTVTQVFEQVAGGAAGDVRAALAALVDPPLADSTLAARRRPNRTRGGVPIASTESEKPLNDTGYMVATLTHLVETT